MPALAAVFIPLLPGLMHSIAQIINAVRDHDGTPAELKAQLDAISADLQGLTKKVAAVQLPD